MIHRALSLESIAVVYMHTAYLSFDRCIRMLRSPVAGPHSRPRAVFASRGLPAREWYISPLAKMFALSGPENLHMVCASLHMSSNTCGLQILVGCRPYPAIHELSPMTLDRTVDSAQLASPSPILWRAQLSHPQLL